MEVDVPMPAGGSWPYRPFGISITRTAGETEVAPSGELDLASADELSGAVRDVWSDGSPRAVVDLADLDFIDSSGLRCLLALRASAAGDGHDLLLRPGPRAVQRIFHLTGTHELFAWRTE